MTILFDLSIPFKLHEGVMIYALNILSGFRDNKYKDIKILCHKELYSYIQKTYPEYTCYLAESIRNQGIINSINITRLWNKQINKIDCDIVFSPYPSLLYLFCSKRIIQTIHDIQPLKVWKGKKLLTYRLLMPIILLRSYKIITISDFVKKEIQHHYHFISSKKIKAISNPVTIDTTPLPPPSNINSPYLLYVSTLWEYKNVFTLIKAFNTIKNQIAHKLVIIGRTTKHWEKEVYPYIINNNLTEKIIHINTAVSSKELSQLYQHTDLFIHPSLLEGFGFPPIEAAIQKVPVITTQEGAIEETTLGLLNYYSPAKDKNNLAKKILQVLKNPPSKEKLEEISRIYQKKYNYIEQSNKIYEFIVKTS